jgi:acyl carrier protein
MREETIIFEKIKELITEIIGEDFIEEYDINMESTLSGDLEMESIEVVELSEKINKYYGKEIAFSDWISKIGLEGLIVLSVKDIVNYIAGCKQLI